MTIATPPRAPCLGDDAYNSHTGYYLGPVASVASDGSAVTIWTKGHRGDPQQPQWREPVVSVADIRRAASERRWGRVAPGMGGETDGVRRWVDGTRPIEQWEGNTPRTVGRGFPERRPRLKAIGNSVVPQIPELIGRAIMRREAELAETRHAA